MNKKERVVFHVGLFKKEELNKDYFNLKDYLYVAPKKNGAYFKTPDRSGEKISTFLEIHYSNPLLFIDYGKSPTEIKEGKIGQEAVWIGKSLRLKKIKDTIIKKPRAYYSHGKAKSIRYRYVVAEVEDDNARTLTPKEYELVNTKFTNKYNKPFNPEEINPQEKGFFYDQIEEIVNKNDSLKKIEGGLEKKLFSLIIATFLGSIFFLFPSITGNIIGNLFTKSYSFIGIILFILTLIFSFILIKNKLK